MLSICLFSAHLHAFIGMPYLVLSSLLDFTGVITTLMSASTTTLMFTVHITSAQSQTSVLNATFSTWSTMMATAPVTTLPRVSNAGSATGLCRQMVR